jgi:hypothetical protein
MSNFQRAFIVRLLLSEIQQSRAARPLRPRAHPMRWPWNSSFAQSRASDEKEYYENVFRENAIAKSLRQDDSLLQVCTFFHPMRVADPCSAAKDFAC